MDNEQKLEQKFPAGKELKKAVARDMGVDGTSISDATVNQASDVYKDMVKFISTQFVNNVELIKQPILEIVSYKDVINNQYRIEYFPLAESDATADGTMPHGELSLADFNGPAPSPFTVKYEVLKQIYQKRQYDNVAFFDMFKNGNGLSVIMGNETKNIKNVIARRKAGEVYKLLNTDSTINKVVGIKDLSTLQLAKLIRINTTELETPSATRVNYTHTNGTTYYFEHQAYSKDFTLIIDTNYENDKAFDIDGTKFNVGQYSIEYGKILRLDFETIATQYSLDTFKNKKAFLIENGAIMGALIYDIAQMLKQPRFKILQEWSMRFGFDKKLDRYIVSFDETVDATDTPSDEPVKVEVVKPIPTTA